MDGYRARMTDAWHLAQVNVARLRAPLDSPELATFVERLESINRLADGSPGFVWRLQTEDGDATAIRAFGDDRLIVNVSVWRSIEALGDFTYASGHREVLGRRREWFTQMAEMHLALWWIPAGTTPSVEEAEQRLDHLRTHGPRPFAFTFRVPFPDPGAQSAIEPVDLWFCPSG
jgi:heme-degrading monooxygenase HmoA